MIARHPSPRAVRRAVDTLAALGPRALAALAQVAIDRLDALRDPDEDLCVDDWAVAYAHEGEGIGDADDAEDTHDAESLLEDDEVDDHGCGCESEDDPHFPLRDRGVVTIPRELITRLSAVERLRAN